MTTPAKSGRTTDTDFQIKKAKDTALAAGYTDPDQINAYAVGYLGSHCESLAYTNNQLQQRIEMLESKL
jgi:hypothetical protein